MKKSHSPSHPVQFLLRVARTYFVHNVLRTAAQMSYYLLFSLFPVLMIIISTLGFLHLDVNKVMQVVQAVPIDESVLEEYVTYVVTNESPALMWAGILMALTASSAAFRGLMLCSGEICGRHNFRVPARFAVSFAMSAVLLLTIFAFLLATVTGRWFSNLLNERFHVNSLTLAWQWLRFPFIFALGVLALTAIYRVCLSKKALPHVKAWPGAVFASVALVAGTALFSMFISMSSSYSMVYGSLASILILMLWFFVCSNILVLGNIVNYELARSKCDDAPTIVFTLERRKRT
jgi:membrane protein